MVTSRTHTQRATAWLCLAVALLIALLPAAGVMVCMGHDGHVGFGATTETGSCPCEHDSATQADLPADLAKNEDRHPPCRDIALEPPEVFKGAELAPKPTKPADTPPDDHSPAIAVWVLGEGGEDLAGATSPPWVASAVARPREQLEHKRTVVLLI